MNIIYCIVLKDADINFHATLETVFGLEGFNSEYVNVKYLDKGVFHVLILLKASQIQEAASMRIRRM